MRLLAQAIESTLNVLEHRTRNGRDLSAPLIKDAFDAEMKKRGLRHHPIQQPAEFFRVELLLREVARTQEVIDAMRLRQ